MIKDIFRRFMSPEISLDKLAKKDEIMTNKTSAVLPQQAPAAGCCCPECSTLDCTHYGNTVSFIAWARVPAGFVFDPNPLGIEPPPTEYVPEFMYNSQGLKCIVDTCSIPNASVTNPCDGTSITGCSVKVKRIRVIGAIKYYVDVFYAMGSPGGGDASPGNEGVLFVDQIINYTCDCEYVCPETITVNYGIALNPAGPITLPNGDTLVPVDVTLTFTL